VINTLFKKPTWLGIKAVQAVVEAAVRSVKHPFRNGKALARENPYDLMILNGKMPGMNSIRVVFRCLTVGYNVHFEI